MQCGHRAARPGNEASVTTTTTPARFHALSIAAHWLTLALLIAVYTLIEFRGVFPKGTALHDGMKTRHFMLGLTVFAIVFLRLVLRLVFRTPPILPRPPAWQRLLATTMHGALYAFLIGIPLLGWLTLSAKGRTIPWFGLELPPLHAPDKALAKTLEQAHEAIGTIGCSLIGAHALAALFHHYALRDNTLRRMLSWRWRTPRLERRGSRP